MTPTAAAAEHSSAAHIICTLNEAFPAEAPAVNGRAVSGMGSRPRLTLGRWPFTPTGDLVRLRETLRRSQHLARPEATEKLLEQIGQELRQRERNQAVRQINGNQQPL